MTHVNGTALETATISEPIENFLQSVFRLTVTEVVKKGKDRSEPVVSFKTPEELQKLLRLDIQNEPQTHEALLKQCTDIIKYSVKTCKIQLLHCILGS